MRSVGGDDCCRPPRRRSSRAASPRHFASSSRTWHPGSYELDALLAAVRQEADDAARLIAGVGAALPLVRWIAYCRPSVASRQTQYIHEPRPRHPRGLRARPRGFQGRHPAAGIRSRGPENLALLNRNCVGSLSSRRHQTWRDSRSVPLVCSCILIETLAISPFITTEQTSAWTFGCDKRARPYTLPLRYSPT